MLKKNIFDKKTEKSFFKKIIFFPYKNKKAMNNLDCNSDLFNRITI